MPKESKPTIVTPSIAPKQEPQKPAILTREELDLIKQDEFLTNKMLEACGSFKWRDLTEEAQIAISTFMRNIIERGI